MPERGGHLIANNTVRLAGNEGIYVVGRNDTITGNLVESCKLGGIRTVSARNVTLMANRCYHNGWGIMLENSSDFSISSNIIFDSTYSGLLTVVASNRNTIWNNTFLFNNGAGDTYSISHIQAYEYESESRWNSTNGYGNYWSDWTAPDGNLNGVVDSPYVIYLNGSRDYYPLTSPPGTTDLETTVSLSGTLGTNGWYQSIVSVSFSTNDFGRGVNATYYRFGASGVWTKYASPFVISDEANSTVDFFSIDNSSVVERAKNATVRIDRVAPILSINEMAEPEVDVDHLEISWVCSDVTSGLDRIEVSLDGGTFVEINLQLSHYFSGLEDGIHNVSVRAIDVAGNEIEKSIEFKVDAGVSGGWTSGDLMLFSIIAAITIFVVLAVIIIIVRRMKSRT